MNFPKGIFQTLLEVYIRSYFPGHAFLVNFNKLLTLFQQTKIASYIDGGGQNTRGDMALLAYAPYIFEGCFDCCHHLFLGGSDFY